MVLSEAEAETRLSDLRRQRESIDRAITDLSLYLELGRRLTRSRRVEDGASEDCGDSPVSSELERKSVPSDAVPTRPKGRDALTLRVPERTPDSVQPKHAAAEPRSAVSPTDDAEAGVVPEGALARRYGRALIEAAIAVLETAGKPLHVSEILVGLTARGFSIPGQLDPVAALNTRLWKRSGPGGPVRRLGDALYALPESIAAS